MKLLLQGLLGCSLFVSPVYAAINCVDAGKVEFNDATPADPETISYVTPDPCSNCLLLVGVLQRTGTTPRTLTVTHAGNAMTETASVQYTDPMGAHLYTLASPTAGTNDVVVNWSTAPLAEAILIWTCQGVNLAAPTHDATGAAGTGTAVTVTVANLVAGDVVVDMFGGETQTVDPGEGANQTVVNKGNDGVEAGWGASFQAAADGGVMSWTLDSSNQWAQQAVALTAASTRRASVPIVLQ